ncbi:hypothetical protein BCU68_16190 [Vibrio sp. 10N.286.49.B3]|uniref:trypsin-like serine peptidase n=1 Tax=Vibrio sp. 10N.286.49.B3 TaxID=1880855 RepID=UPI000C83315D|nr:trypsin-like serine protease [Vibrio sp. 10N.286.49.B3]PMH40598.1 hypothetical protein BCU68_16190 [Vibrio sp. 10N.286.49.B3]
MRLLYCLFFILYSYSSIAQSSEFTGVGRLFINSGKTCTATLVSSNTVLTAAHCVYNHKTQQYILPKNITFQPYSKNRTANKVEAITYTVGMRHLPQGAFTQDKLYGDWALIRLKKPLGCSLARFKLAKQSSKTVHRKLVVASYQQGSQNQLIVDESCQYAQTPTKNSMLRFKSCDLVHGASGAAIMAVENGELVIVGTISAGANDSKGRYRVFAVPNDSFRKKIQELSQACY